VASAAAIIAAVLAIAGTGYWGYQQYDSHRANQLRDNAKLAAQLEAQKQSTEQAQLQTQKLMAEETRRSALEERNKLEQERKRLEAEKHAARKPNARRSCRHRNRWRKNHSAARWKSASGLRWRLSMRRPLQRKKSRSLRRTTAPTADSSAPSFRIGDRSAGRRADGAQRNSRRQLDQRLAKDIKGNWNHCGRRLVQLNLTVGLRLASLRRRNYSAA